MHYIGLNTRFGSLSDLLDGKSGHNYINTMGHGFFYNSTYGLWVVGCDTNRRTNYSTRIKFVGTAFSPEEAQKMFKRACRMYGVPEEIK